jgi:hypothetical protein
MSFERISFLNVHVFFKNKRGLAESVAKLEEQMKFWLPNLFEATTQAYKVGEDATIIIGKMHTCYFTGIEMSDGKQIFIAFENKSSVKSFFAKKLSIT